jgi:hypothetical protein
MASCDEAVLYFLKYEIDLIVAAFLNPLRR